MEENNQERIALAEFSERIGVLRDHVSKVIVGQQEKTRHYQLGKTVIR